MSYDMSRINNIENNLKSNPSNISTNDLIYYLKYNTNNNQLDPNNIENTQNYLNQINNSFFYEDIFVNTSNYSSFVAIIIGLLIPFYYFYPRFYTLGSIGFFIGLISLLCLYFKFNSLYSNFFTSSGKYFIILTFSIYIIFFILLNKLNHISLFFISAVLSYLILNYVFRVILTLPTESNTYNQYKATFNNNTNYTQYNLLLETTCFQIIDRFNLKLPSGNMLYSYLTVFQIGTNNYKIFDFLTNLFGPIISIVILYLFRIFLSKVTNFENINLFPIIGINRDSDEYTSCQANYILPKELNVDLLIHGIIDKYNFNNNLYNNVQKALLRISHELLIKYNPKFINITNVNKNVILQNLKNNKIFIRINKILQKNNFEFNLNYMDQIKQFIDNDHVPYKNKEEMYDLLKQINNTLLVINEVNVKYQNDSILARDELLYNKDIDEEYKPLLKKITDEYIKNFTDNLKENILFGYDYNIITYSLLGQNVRLFSNKIFNFILSLLSVWLVFVKPIGSPWLIVKYILNEKHEFKNLLEKLSGKSIIWKYFSMGLDTSYFEEIYKNLKNNSQDSILEKGLNILYSVILFIFILPILYLYNSITFGFTLDPSWYNMLYQFVFILNILGNIYCYYTKGSFLLYNIKFFIGFIFVFIFISIIQYLITNFKK